eukprot:scaffold126544_cov18-Tisochrysis_lutea.AAC.4
MQPPPGVYARGVHAIGAANAAMASMPGGQKAQKMAEQVRERTCVQAESAEDGRAGAQMHLHVRAQ